MWEIAYAQANAAAKQPSVLESLFPIIFIFVVFYFLIIRPQSKQRKLHSEMIQNLKIGDEVIAAGGIFGKVKGLTDKFLTLEVDEGMTIKVVRSQVMSLAKNQDSKTN